MKIIISPAKIMRNEVVGVDVASTPTFLNDALNIWQYLKTLDDKSLTKIWDCNQDILKENKIRLANNDLKSNLLPALMVYDGLQFKKMAANVFDDKMWEYVNKHLIILSGLYGLLHPLDGINPYRMMMGAPINLDGHKSLYSYWGDRLYKELIKDNDHDILNLASKEYYDVIKPYLSNLDHMVDVTFLSKNKAGSLVVKSTEAKSCRGAMVRYLASHNFTNLDDVKGFSDFNYKFDEALSSENNFVFIKQN